MSQAPVSVALVSQTKEMWGNERQILGLAPALADRGVVLTLLAPAGEWLEVWRSAGLPGEVLALPSHGGLRGEGGSGRPGPRDLGREVAVVWRSVAAIRSRVRAFDAVLSVSLWGHVEVALAGRLARRPVALMLVDIVVPGLGRTLLQGASRLADVTVTNSAATSGTLARGGRTELIHPGVDMTVFHPGARDERVRAALGGGPTDILVGIVGRLDEEKGIHVLLDAFADAAADRPALRLAVIGGVGTGPADYAAALRDQAAALGDRVQFPGRRADVPEVLRSLDVLVNASRAEPFGLSVLEAQASGVPVIGTRAGGIPDFVEHDRTGLLVDPGDREQLAEALARLADDRGLRARLASTALDQVQARFDVELQFDRYATLLRELGGRR